MTSLQVAYEGIYDAPTAARYLLAARGANEAYPVTSRHLIRWVRIGLMHPDLALVPGRDLTVAFEDLISMRVIAAVRAAGVSWPRIRVAEEWLRQRTGHLRPFATEQLWTERSDVLTELGDQLIAASRYGQLAMEMLREYLIPVSGLRFEDEVASSWEPRSYVVLDPAVQFGEPCIRNTRIPTRAVWGLVRGGDPESLVMQSYGISEDELKAALAWEDKVAA
ncbi:MAG: DUF433 domain-containing protein [Chloroflexi bacterium]|nr:DUF433 domain-containing protein [Chloroflexota bacterium]